MKATFEEMMEVFEEVVDLSGLSLTPQSVLGVDMALDSKEMLMVISRLEAKYSFRLDPREMLSIRTLGDIIGAINRAINRD
jgi:acyl carrier protein